MSLQWTLVATFLYVEIAIMVLFLLPFISPLTWRKILKSRIATGLASYGSLYFNVILIALVLLLIDAIREITKYKSKSTAEPAGHNHYGPTMELVKEFRAQRNFYISGTALFLWFVLKRFISLIQNSAVLMIDNEVLKKQAHQASETARNTIENASKKTEEEKKASANETSSLEKELIQKEEQVDNLKSDLERARKDLEAMKAQSLSTQDAFDNLLKENEKLMKKLEKLESQSGESKKEN